MLPHALIAFDNAAKDWRYILYAGNGQPMARSVRGYAKKQKAANAAYRCIGNMKWTSKVVAVDTDGNELPFTS